MKRLYILAAVMWLAALMIVISVHRAEAFLEPPARLNKSYPGGVIVKYFPREKMWEECSKLAGRTTANHPAECGVVKMIVERVGGRQIKRMQCYVYIMQGYLHYIETRDVLFRHGRAHCFGWADHRGGIEVGRPGIPDGVVVPSAYP